MFRWEGDKAVCIVKDHTIDLTKQVLSIGPGKIRKPPNPRPPSAVLAKLQKGRLSFVVGALVVHKAKQVDDGVYAAMELAVQGSARLGKQHVLTAVADALEATAPSATAFEQWKGQKAGKLLGFYTQSAVLEQIYHQDKLAQQLLLDLLPSGNAKALCCCIHEMPTMSTAVEHRVEQNMVLYTRLTNPHDAPSALEPPLHLQTCLYPPSMSPKAILTVQLMRKGVDPGSIDLMAEVTRRVRVGTLSLWPSEEFRWYAHCLWAIEMLLRPCDTPKAQKLEMSDGYMDHLESLFKATMAATHETHVKHLRMTYTGFFTPLWSLSPRLMVELLAEYYLRCSQAFQFVLSKELAGMHRLRKSGPVAKPLVDDLEEMVLLFQGLHDVVMHELGFSRSKGNYHPPAAEHAARIWLRSVTKDKDLRVNNRMMVPVSYHSFTGLYKVWCILGLTPQNLEVHWSTLAKLFGSRRSFTLQSATYTNYKPVFAEVHTRMLLDRRQFQKVCDKHRGIGSILKAIGCSREDLGRQPWAKRRRHHSQLPAEIFAEKL
eukprot:m51a1_g7986 hypothetical protein (543) ;mRNA; f:76897-79962